MLHKNAFRKPLHTARKRNAVPLTHSCSQMKTKVNTDKNGHDHSEKELCRHDSKHRGRKQWDYFKHLSLPARRLQPLATLQLGYN